MTNRTDLPRATAVAPRLLAALLAVALLGAAGEAWAAASPKHATGLPVPRFVSIRPAEVNLRTGPGTRYPVEWIVRRQGMPVEITAEYDTWRRIRDAEGTEGWVHQSMVSNRRGIIVTGEQQAMLRDRDAAASPVVRVDPGVVGKLKTCRDDWCRVEVGGFSGWLRRSQFWGVYPHEFRD